MTLSSLNPALCNHYQDEVVSLNAPDRLDAEAAIVLKRQAVGSMVGLFWCCWMFHGCPRFRPQA